MGLIRSPRHGAEVEVGLSVDGLYGSAVTDGAAVCRLVIDKINVGTTPNKYVTPSSHGSLQPIRAESVVNVSGSTCPISVAGPYNRHTIGMFVGACLQTGTYGIEAFDGPFTFFDAGSHPQFNGDQNSFTLLQKTGVTAEDEYTNGNIIQNFTISGEAGGKVMFSAEGQSMGSGSFAETLTGTWQTSGSKTDNYGFVEFNDLAFTLDVGDGTDVSVSVKSFEVTAGYDSLEPLKSDGAGGWAAKAFGRPQGSASITLLADAVAYSTLQNQIDGDLVTLKITGGLTLTCTAQIDTRELLQEGLQDRTLAGTLYAADASSDMITFTP